MKTDRENIRSLYARKGFDRVPYTFGLCDSLREQFEARTGEKNYALYYDFPMATVSDLTPPENPVENFYPYHTDINDELNIDKWGVGHRKISKEAMHMTRFCHPLANAASVEEILSYPFPDYLNADETKMREDVKRAHAAGKFAVGGFESASWELGWYLRGMDNLFVDMMSEDPIAEAVLDAVNIRNTHRAVAYADAGVDAIYFGDDIGMQRTIMMSLTLYEEWIAPRLTQLCKAVKEANPDTIIVYHSCGFVEPYIPSLLRSGIDVLNPVQPESMDFEKLHEQYGDVLSFNGTIGTQTTMPFGTPKDVRDAVERNLKIAGDRGGLFPAPTHLLEPEVPWENIMAYLDVCKNYAK